MGREWDDSSMAGAFTSFSARLSHTSRNSTQLPAKMFDHDNAQARHLLSTNHTAHVRQANR